MGIIAIPIIIYGKWPFFVFAQILSIASFYELMHAKENKEKLPMEIKVISYLLLFCFIFLNSENSDVTLGANYYVTLLIFLIIPVTTILNSKKYNIESALFLIGAILFLGIGFKSLIIIRNTDLLLLIYLLLITTFTDMFALFGGKLIGKHKLCTEISPNKTIEGSLIGSLVGSVVGILFYMLIIDPTVNIFIVSGITLLLSIIGQFGDLVFSSIKRTYNIKDFSKLIPGHGGILDRLDSLLFVSITFMLFMNIL